MRLCIAGSRDHKPEFLEIEEAIHWTQLPVETIITGGCRGVDECADAYARDRKIHAVVYPADWENYGKRAGPLRNRQMAGVGDALLILGPADGRGTRSVMEEFHREGKPVYVHLARSIVQ